MKKLGHVFIGGQKVGEIEERIEKNYCFQYVVDDFASKKKPTVSLTLPWRSEP